MAERLTSADPTAQVMSESRTCGVFAHCLGGLLVWAQPERPMSALSACRMVRRDEREGLSVDRACRRVTERSSSLGRRLTTPHAAAVAGVLFAVLLGTSTVLLRLSVPADLGDSGEWIDASRSRVNLALALVPFAGISFLWFIGVVRDRLGDREDRFFASVMLGSGLLYLAMLFASSALSAAIVATYEAAPEQFIDSGGYEFGREAVFALSNTFGVRMAGVFMLSTGTIWWRSGIVPRGIAALTFTLAVLQVVGPGISLWTTLVFPFWVLIVSVHFLAVRNGPGIVQDGR